MELTPTDLAYAAGVIDSDGYIGVQHSDYRVRVRKDSQTPTYSARIIVKQVEPQAVDLLRVMWGGVGGALRRGRPGTGSDAAVSAYQARAGEERT